MNENQIAESHEPTASASDSTAREPTVLRPATDLFADDERFVWVIDLPGVKPDALDIEVVDRHLVVDATDSSGELRFKRRFEVPDSVDLTQVDAELNEGQLRIEVRKRAELQPRKISLKTQT